jgi:hypothetical protein
MNANSAMKAPTAQRIRGRISGWGMAVVVSAAVLRLFVGSGF